MLGAIFGKCGEYINWIGINQPLKVIGILALRKRYPLNTFRVNISYLFVAVFLEGIGRK